jgi:hypothetical protein
MSKTIYKILPLRVGEAEVGKALDVFWSLTKSSGPVTVPIDRRWEPLTLHRRLVLMASRVNSRLNTLVSTLDAIQ